MDGIWLADVKYLLSKKEKEKGSVIIIKISVSDLEFHQSAPWTGLHGHRHRSGTAILPYCTHLQRYFIAEK